MENIMDLIIRNERVNEYRAIEELTREAFWDIYVPGCNEHFLLHNMRSHSDFIPELDFVAELDGKPVGNIVYTHARIIDDKGKSHKVICFGPISVMPSLQKQGIGSALIRHSFEKARSMGFKAVCIYGDPRYYHRFGFRSSEKYDITNSEGKYAFALMAHELVPGALRNISGRLFDSEAYKVDEDDFQRYEKTFPHKDKTVIQSQTEFRILSGLVY
jgi:putative acetyltransferase